VLLTPLIHHSPSPTQIFSKAPCLKKVDNYPLAATDLSPAEVSGVVVDFIFQ